MGIDLTIPGDPGSIRQLAEWLDPTLAGSLDGLKRGLETISDDSSSAWRGKTGSAFRTAVNGLADAVEPVDVYARDAAEVFRAYAGRLERGKETFAEYAESARETWLTVMNSVIAPPMAPPQYASNAGESAPIDRGPNGECLAPMPIGAYEKSAALYKRIAEDVGTWWGELENWINEHMVPLISRILDFDPLIDLSDSATNARMLAKGTYDLVANLDSAAWNERLKLFEEGAAKAREEADTHRKRLRAGNPAVKSAAEAVTEVDLVAKRDALDGLVSQTQDGKRLLLRGGVVLDVVLAATEIAEGGSPSGAVAGLVGGLGGGAVAGAILAATTVPPVGVAALVVGASMAAGAATKWAWEASVPLDVREAIDAGDFGYVFGGETASSEESLGMR